jgi:membrane-associated phospholipid phosphatase
MLPNSSRTVRSIRCSWSPIVARSAIARAGIAAIVVSSLIESRTVAAQTPDTSSAAAGVQTASERPRPPEPLFTARDALVAGAFALGTVAMFPVDRWVAERLQDPAVQENRFFDRAARGFEFIATPGAYYIGGTLYLVGRVARLRRVADLGWHGTEALFVAEGVGNLLKRMVGRARPHVSGASNPSDYELAGGFRTEDRRSFPSGHTFTAFAAAAAVTSETSRWWPRSTWLVAPLMYGGATMVGLSRMYHNKHWASDVVLGAAIGTFSGLKVVRYHHSHPGNRLDRWLLGSVAVLPDGRGGAVVFVSLPSPSDMARPQ